MATRRRGFPTHPGHWLLLAAAAWTVAIAAVVVFGGLFQAADVWQGLALTIATLAAATVSGLGAFRATRQGTDLWIFPLLGLAMVGVAIACFGLVVALSDVATAPPLSPLFTLVGLGWIFASATTLIAVCIDLQHGRRRDLYHWAGLINAALIVTHPVFQWIVGQLTMY
jgi:hypothetical protein